MLYCASKARMRQQIDQVRKKRGAANLEGPSGLKMNRPVPVESILEQIEKGGLKMAAPPIPPSVQPPVPARSS